MNAAVLQLIQSWPEQTKLILRIIGLINHSIFFVPSPSFLQHFWGDENQNCTVWFVYYIFNWSWNAISGPWRYFIVFIDGSWLSHIFPIFPIFIDFTGWFTLFANFSWLMKNTPWHYCIRNALTVIMSDTLLFQQMVKIPNFFHKTSFFVTWNFAAFTLWFGCYLIYANVSLWF